MLTDRLTRLRTLLLAGSLTVLLFSNAVSGQTHDDPRWVSSWATAPSTLPGGEGPVDDAER